MSFQAPFDIMDYARLRMTAEAQQQEQQQQAQQQYMQTITGALGDIANMYQQEEEMKAGVKAGEHFGKTFGKQFGLDPAVYTSPEYKGMGLQAQYQFNKGILGNFGSLSQNFNYGLNAGIRQAAPQQRAMAQNQATIAGQGGPTQMAFPPSINPDVIP